jgi:hypothetical protein
VLDLPIEVDVTARWRNEPGAREGVVSDRRRHLEMVSPRWLSVVAGTRLQLAAWQNCRASASSIHWVRCECVMALIPKHALLTFNMARRWRTQCDAGHIWLNFYDIVAR